jgi:hypothetical protein
MEAKQEEREYDDDDAEVRSEGHYGNLGDLGMRPNR